MTDPAPSNAKSNTTSSKRKAFRAGSVWRERVRFSQLTDIKCGKAAYNSQGNYGGEMGQEGNVE